MTLTAKPGDRLVVEAHRVGEPKRDAEVLEVRNADGTPPYFVQWSDDGHKGWVYPGSDAHIEHYGEGIATTRKR